jgi:ferritin-like protein
VLSRALVDEKLVGTGSITLCYFFFKDNDEQNKIATALCTLLHQLFWNNEDLCHKHAVPAIRKCGEALKGNSEELWRIFISAATDPSAGTVICILDALDECQVADRNKLINRLEDFYGRYVDEPKRESRLKFLVTSRPYSDIEYGFSKLTRDIPTIRLAGENESETISQEIRIVIEAKVTEIAERCRLSNHLRSALRERLCEIPNRTYLWLYLTLDEVKSRISKGKTESKLLNLINTLPRTVEDAYEKILANCDQEEARKILHILIAARRPLTVNELDVALEVEPDSMSWELERQYDDRKESIRENCGLFVSIVDSRVYLIHQTAREFLIWKSVGSSEPQRWKHSINLREGNRLLSEKCVAYLLFYESQTNTSLTQVGTSFQNMQSFPKAETQEHPFLDYAATHWISHVQEARLTSTDWISRTTQLCDIGDGLSCTWFNIYSKSALIAMSTGRKKRIALHWGVGFGLVNETRYLLESSFDCDGSEFSIQEIFVDAAKSNSHGRELLDLFLDRRGDKVMITRQVLQAAAGNRGSGNEIMALLLNRRGDEVQITEEVVTVAARNGGSGKEIIALLLNRRGDEVKITEKVVKAAALNYTSGKEVMTLLLDRRGHEVKITEEVVKAAALNYTSGKEVMTLLLDRRGHEVKITEEVVKAAALNYIRGKGVMTLLLDRRGHEGKITEEVVKAAAKKDGSGKEIMALLLDRLVNGSDMSPETVATAARFSDGKAIAILLDQRGDEIKITEQIVKAAALNYTSGKEVMTLLLDRRGHEVKITEAVMKAAAENKGSGKEIMALLLNRRGDEVEITEQVVEAAATNKENVKEIVTLLFNWRVDRFDTSPRSVATVARLLDERAIAILLDQRGDEIEITEQVVEAAATNEESGKEIMTLLLDRQGDDIKITQRLLEAIGTNRKSCKKIMILLLNRQTTRAQLQQVFASGELSFEQLTSSLFRIELGLLWMYLRSKDRISYW